MRRRAASKLVQGLLLLGGGHCWGLSVRGGAHLNTYVTRLGFPTEYVCIVSMYKRVQRLCFCLGEQPRIYTLRCSHPFYRVCHHACANMMRRVKSEHQQ